MLERSGPGYELSCPLEEQPGWTEHAAFMDGLVDASSLVLGGPLSDEYRAAHAVEAESEDAVRVTFARDPWSGSHLRVSTRPTRGRTASTGACARPNRRRGAGNEAG